MLINVQMPTIVGILTFMSLTFMSMTNTTSMKSLGFFFQHFRFFMTEQLKFHAQLN